MTKKNVIFSPVNGTVLDLGAVNDPMFSNRTMGDGVAFEFTDSTVYAPADGTILMIAVTKHAVGMRLDDGTEILIHIGTDTVNLNGEGFTVFVEPGERVKRGQKLVEIDWEIMRKNNINMITPMVFTNSRNLDIQFGKTGRKVKAGETEICQVQMKNAEQAVEDQQGYAPLCTSIIEKVGGKDNVLSVTHCITRLRFKLKDESKADTRGLENMDEVMQVIQTGGQYQVVVGTKVDEIYDELVKIGGFRANTQETQEPQEKGKQSIFSRFLVLMSSLFQPILGMLAAAGMIKALLTVLNLLGWLSPDSGTYIILNALGDGLFYFFPVAVGWSAAKQFGIKEIYGITLGCCMMYPTLLALTDAQPLYTLFTGTMFETGVYTEFLGIPVLFPGAGYANSVIPIIFVVYFASILYKYLSKHLPTVIRSFFVPFITMVITFPVALCVIGPVAMLLQSVLGAVVNWLVGLNLGIAGLVIGSLWSILVMFGLHMPIIMMFNVNIATYGYDVINPLIFSGALATIGAVLGVIIRTKSVKEKNICIPAMISSFFGINEPALYGVLIPRKKIMVATFLSAGIGSMIAGFAGAKLYTFGASGPLGLPAFINPAGIDAGFIGLCIGAVVSFVLALVFSLIFGPHKDTGKDNIQVSVEV